MKNNKKIHALLLALSITLVPITEVSAISIKNISLKDIVEVEEVIKDEDKEDIEEKPSLPVEKDENSVKYKTDKEYLDAAMKSIEWFNFFPDSDSDLNIVTYFKSELVKKGFGQVNIELKSVINSIGEGEYISPEGNINYYYKDPESEGMYINPQVRCEFEITKGEEKQIYKKNISIGWDKPKVRKMIEKNIFPLLSEDKIKAKNTNLNNIETEITLPMNISKYVTVNWKSSNREALDVKEKGFGYNEENKFVLLPSIGVPRRKAEDQKLKLIAEIKFNQGSKPNETIVYKEFDIVVNGFNVPLTLKQMQEQLDKNYTSNKIKDISTREIADLNNVTNDLSLPTPRDTGIDKFFDYKFSASSNNPKVKITGSRINVIRPLPNDEPYNATITINMEHRKNKISVNKSFDIKVMPLTDKEINDEIELLEKVKEKYFEGIKGNNIDKDHITENLHAFSEAYLDGDELKFAYGRKEEKGIGIIPDELKSEEYQEQWRLFRTSNRRVIEHENLLVRKPTYNTKIKIDSVLSSIKYGKYSETYPEHEGLKRLYKQPVSVEVTVLGENGENKEDNLNKELNINYAVIYFDKFGRWDFDKQPNDIKIKQNESGEVTVYDLLINSGVKFEGSQNWISSINNIKGPDPNPDQNFPGGGWMYSVNDVNPDKMIGDYILKDGDNVLFYCTYNYKQDKKVKWSELLEEEIDDKDGDKEVDKEVDKKDINNVIKDMREHYNNKSEFTFREALGFNYSSNNMEKDYLSIDRKLKLKENNSVSNVSGNIMGIIASGNNPYNYNGKDYVKILKDSQKSSGKFIISNYDDYPSIQAFALMALDMSKAEYNKNIIDVLLSYQDNKGSFSDNEEFIDTDGIILSALGNHLDRKDVRKSVNNAVSYLQKNWRGKNQWTLSSVIQGIIAAGEDINSKKWSIDNKNIQDELLNFYTTENKFGDISANEQAFLAITDIYRNKSIYTSLRTNFKSNENKEEEKVKDEKIASIYIEPINRSIYEGETIYLSIIAKNKNNEIVKEPELEIISNNKNIDILSNGKIVCKNPGKYTIEVKDKNSDIKSKIQIEVLEKAIEKTIKGPKENEILKNNEIYEVISEVKNNTNKPRKIKFILAVYEKDTGKLVDYSIREKEIGKNERIKLSSGIKTEEKGNFYLKSFIWDEEIIKIFNN